MQSLDDCPAHLRPALIACSTGQLPANVALMQVLIRAKDESEIRRVLRQVEIHIAGEPATEAAARLRELLALWRANPQAAQTVKMVLSDVDHGGTAPDPQQGVAYWASMFDRMVRTNPEGSVALYALGSADLLDAATREVVEHLRRWHVLGRNKAILEIGCGIGRFVAALAPEVGHVMGIDIADGMIALARQRCGHLPNVTLQKASGHDLAPVAAGSIDLVLAADVFPYLVQTGAPVVRATFAEVARVLKPGGTCVILNYSYRGDAESDREDVSALAAAEGLVLDLYQTGVFNLWDAAAFRLIRPSPKEGAAAS